MRCQSVLIKPQTASGIMVLLLLLYDAVYNNKMKINMPLNHTNNKTNTIK